MKRLKTLLPPLVAVMFVGCSQIDCPLDNHVLATWQLRGDVTRLTDYLSVWSARENHSDTLLLNLNANTSRFMLPMSYGHDVDELVFSLLSDEGDETLDTVRIRKTNESHFESVDCGPVFFHTILDIQFTRHAIDSVVKANTRVDYDTSKTNINIYFKPGF